MSSTPVYTGRWTDWSHGSILGPRVTMTTSHGGLLIAFIALFNTAVGSITWSLVAYALHQYRAKKQSGDALSHQTQALLRNSFEALAFARNTAATGWQWHNRTPRALLRTLPLAFLGLLVPISFAVAGVMASRVAITGTVLYNTTFCGTLNIPQNISYAITAEANAEVNRQWALSLAYANGCYKNPLKSDMLAEQEVSQTTPPATDCGFFVQKEIPWNVTFPGFCPFQDACGVGADHVIRLDTGLLDSGTYLGHNQPEQNRVLFRMVDTCSPLKSEGFSTGTYENTPLYDMLGNVSLYSYGLSYVVPSYVMDLSNENTTANRNALSFLSHNNVTFVYPQSALASVGGSYDILATSTTSSGDNAAARVFTPNPSLSNDTDTRITLVALANHVRFAQPINDPWFNATVPFTVHRSRGGYETVYVSSNPLTMLACIEQFHICNPNNMTTEGEPTCSSDLNYFGNYNPQTQYWPTLDTLGLNDYQKSIAATIGYDSLGARLDNLMGMGPRVLDANAYTSNERSYTAALPSNQWQIEVNSWFATKLSILQLAMIADVSAPSNLLRQYFLPIPANNTVVHDLCKSQKFRSTAYQSFSIVGLTINFAIGGLLLILGLCLTDIHPCFRNKKSAKLQAWMGDGALQLQRVAYEGQNIGTWDRDVQTVPWTLTQENLNRPQIFHLPGDEETAQKEGPTAVPKTGVVHTVTDVRDSASEHTATPENGAEIDGNMVGAVAHGYGAIPAMSPGSRTERDGDSAQEAHHLHPRGPARP